MALTTTWDAISSRGARWFRVVVRLGEGVTDPRAEALMTEAYRAGVAAYREAGGGDDDGAEAVVELGSFMMARGPKATTNSRVTLWLAGVSLLVLLIACANVANLMLARGLDRRRERAVRLAFGVSRRRLVVQSLSESLLLSLLGGAAAVFVASWTGRALYELMLPGIPLPVETVDLRLVGFLALVTLSTSLAAGVLPAVQAMGTPPGDVLRNARRGSSGGGGRTRSALTFAQVGLSTILLTGAGLFVQSLRNALDVDLGFDHAAAINVEFQFEAGLDGDRRDQLVREARETLRDLPGVASVIASTDSRPLYGWNEQSRMRPSRIDSVPPLSTGGPFTYAASEGYVETTGIRIVEGRGFEPGDFSSGAAPVLMVSRSFADGAWPGLDPLRECVTLDRGPIELDGPEPCRPVVGVYQDMMVRSLADEGLWSVTWPLPRTAQGLRGILVRAEGNPLELVEPIRGRLSAMSSDIRWVAVSPMTSRIDAMLGPWRTGATLFAAFGVLALVLASIGLYGVLSFSVVRRRREIGIRAALGARRIELLTMVLARAARIAGAGLLAGTVVALLAARSLEAVLFDVPATSPRIVAGVALLLSITALLAAWVPAWRATSIDPAGAMSSD
jgi:predicted permease